MHYFLAKTDPETYSIFDLQKEKETIWDGVHNYQAIAVIKTWQPGDKVFVYHSQGEKKIVGMMEVVSEAYKDPNDKRDISWVAQVKFLQHFKLEEQVSLSDVKTASIFDDFKLVSNSRLSTMASPENFVQWMQKKISF